jgi:hypothetical protein
MFRTLMSGRSFFNCYEVMRLTPTANPDQPLVFSDGKSKIFETRFSPNRVEFGVTVGNEPSRVFMNQNFSDGWRADAGPLVRDPESGKPSLVLPAGWAGRVAFTFIPPQLILGAIIGVLALAVSLFATIRDVRLPSAR